MPKRTRPYREAKLARLRDPIESASYLNAALEESDEDFLIALRDIAETYQVTALAHKKRIHC